ncbi:unnamed protein product [Prunus brigantina]
MAWNAPRRRENRGFEGKIRTKEDLSSGNERAPLERRRDDEVESDLGFLLSGYPLDPEHQAARFATKAAGSKFQVRIVQRTNECYPACCQKHPLDQWASSLPFLHQNWLKQRKGKKKNSKPRVEAPTAQLREKRMLSPQIP